MGAVFVQHNAESAGSPEKFSSAVGRTFRTTKQIKALTGKPLLGHILIFKKLKSLQDE